MSDQTWTWTTEEVFESRLGAGAAFITQVTERLVEFGWSDGDVYAVRLALEEGITNAIRHGNQLDPNKQVTANCRLAANRVLIEILDQGHGFDPERVPDPTEPENLERPGGRGLLLMRSYMTRVEYSPRGNHLVMEKHLTQ